eukprot:jgi/Hompol1/3274/HPOL_006444-RA
MPLVSSAAVAAALRTIRPNPYLLPLRSIRSLSSIAHASPFTPHSWGVGNEGQLGSSHEFERDTPKPISDLAGKEVVALANGVFHSAAIVRENDQGRIYTWGSNFFGQAGYFPDQQGGLFSSDDDEVVWEPHWLKEGLEHENVLQISCGDFHTIALTESGKVLTWGAGILGHGNEYFDSRPIPIKTFLDQAQTAHISHVCARHGLSFAVASPKRNAPPSQIYIWGQYDTDESGSKRIKSTIPVPMQLKTPFNAIELVQASHHLIVIRGIRNSQTVFAVYGSHPAQRAVSNEPESVPYYAHLEQIP